MALPFAASEIYQYIRLETYCQVNFGTSHSGLARSFSASQNQDRRLMTILSLRQKALLVMPELQEFASSITEEEVGTESGK